MLSLVTEHISLFVISDNDLAVEPESSVGKGDHPSLDIACQLPGEGLSSQDRTGQASLSPRQPRTEAMVNPTVPDPEPPSQPISSGLASHEESSTRRSALQETDDSDDDPVLIPGARYRGGVGHRLVLSDTFLQNGIIFD